jgi:hypothetical protein
MSNTAIHKASELAPDVRRAVESMLGRPLDSEEHISLTAYRVAQAAAGEDRANLSRQLEQRIDKSARKTEIVSDDELDAVIDEAVDHIRHHRS